MGEIKRPEGRVPLPPGARRLRRLNSRRRRSPRASQKTKPPEHSFASLAWARLSVLKDAFRCRKERVVYDASTSAGGEALEPAKKRRLPSIPSPPSHGRD